MDNRQDTVIQGWVARDKDSDKLYIYGYKPERLSDMWYSPGAPFEIEISSDLFPDITWESDPIEVELIIKRKKKTENQ